MQTVRFILQLDNYSLNLMGCSNVFLIEIGHSFSSGTSNISMDIEFDLIFACKDFFREDAVTSFHQLLKSGIDYEAHTLLFMSRDDSLTLPSLHRLKSVDKLRIAKINALHALLQMGKIKTWELMTAVQIAVVAHELELCTDLISIHNAAAAAKSVGMSTNLPKQFLQNLIASDHDSPHMQERIIDMILLSNNWTLETDDYRRYVYCLACENLLVHSVKRILETKPNYRYVRRVGDDIGQSATYIVSAFLNNNIYSKSKRLDLLEKYQDVLLMIIHADAMFPFDLAVDVRKLFECMQQLVKAGHCDTLRDPSLPYYDILSKHGTQLVYTGFLTELLDRGDFGANMDWVIGLTGHDTLLFYERTFELQSIYKKHKEKFIQFYVNHNYNLQQLFNKKTLLMIACEKYDYKSAELLLRAGADVNYVLEEEINNAFRQQSNQCALSCLKPGEQPFANILALLFAYGGGKYPDTRILLTNSYLEAILSCCDSFDVWAELFPVSNSVLNAMLAEAIAKPKLARNPNIWSLLFEGGAEFDIASLWRVSHICYTPTLPSSLWQMVVDSGADLNKPCISHGRTFLMLAADAKSIEGVKLFISEYALVNFVNDDGYTAIDYTAERTMPATILELLLNHGARSFRLQSLCSIMQIENALYLIGQMVQILKEEESLLDRDTLDSLLMLCFKSKDAAYLADFFIDLGAKIIVSTLTYVLDAREVTNEQVAAVAMIIVRRVPQFSSSTSKSGRLTFLMAACRFRSPVAANIFLDAGATAEMADKKGRTVLHHLALGIASKDNGALDAWEKNRMMDLTKRLLLCGANKDAVDRDGNTAKEILVTNGQAELAALLL